MRRDEFQKRLNRATKRADVRYLLNKIGLQYKEKSHGDLWFRCIMPSHKTDKDASCHINSNPLSENHGMFHCFGCKASGSIITLVKNSWDLRFSEALIMVEAHCRDDDIEGPEKDSVNPVYKTPKAGPAFPKFYEFYYKQSDWDEKYLAYIKKRRISWEQTFRHRIGYVDAGTYNNRLIIPIMLYGHLRTWVARSILSNSDTRITSMPNGLVGLFGSELADPRLGPAILFEGWADALRVEQIGYPNCMAAQTSALHEIQWEFIKQFEYTIVMPDGDNGGNFFIDSLAPYIDDHEFLIARVPWGQDPDESSDEENVKAIEEATKWAPSKPDVELKFELGD